MDQKTFNRFRDIVYEKSGISINENKIALVVARVGKRMRELSITEHADYLGYVLNDKSGEEMVHLLDVISTNVTSFFRESAHFSFLDSTIKKWVKEGQSRLRIWCAAASTGEEPYTIGMTVLDSIETQPMDIKILATDLSTRVLATCERGVYAAGKTEGIPDKFKKRFFTKTDGHYAVGKELRRLLSFSRVNLSQPPFPMKGPFDVIFCRNVMIYFDNVIRTNLLIDMFRLLRPGGYLFVGHAETLTGLLSEFKPVAPSIYTKL